MRPWLRVLLRQSFDVRGKTLGKTLAAYRRLREDLDRAMEIVAGQHAGQLRCGPGCASCCRSFSVLPVEAAALDAAWRRVPVALRGDGQRLTPADDACPFLWQGLCLVYGERPIICRTQGLPIGYVDEERECIEVSACPLNFPVDSELAPEALLVLDPFNARLREVNDAFLLARGLRPDTPRIPLELIAAGGLPAALRLP